MRQFINLVESFDTVTLYHGTNSELAEIIRGEGFIPFTSDDYVSLMIEWAERVVPQPLPRNLVNAIRQHARGYRTPMTHLTPVYDVALRHASDHVHQGGEIGWELSEIIRDETGIEATLFPNAEPVVIEVQIPRHWCENYNHDRQYEVVVRNRTIPPECIKGIRATAQ